MTKPLNPPERYRDVSKLEELSLKQPILYAGIMAYRQGMDWDKMVMEVIEHLANALESAEQHALYTAQHSVVPPSILMIDGFKREVTDE